MSNFSEETIDIDLLGISNEERYKLPKSIKDIDYTKFISNNWLKDDTNNILKEIKKRGAAVWVNRKGNLCWRINEDAPVVELEQHVKAERVLSAFLEYSFQLRLFRWKGEQPPQIALNHLYMVHDEFTPFSNSEFYFDNGVWFRTSFKPSPYLRGNYAVESPDIGAIDLLISNLVNYKDEQKAWVYNWLAGFFQTLEKSQVSLVLRGDQGSGKGIFFNEVISPLFGKDYCIAVDSDNLESDFKNWIDARLFLNLNEIAVDMKSRRGVKNFLKQLVTDEYVNVQTKFKDFRPVKIYGNILITSNEAFPIEVEVSDRRFTIFQTGKGLKAQGLDMFEFIAKIRQELPAFAKFLKEYKVDWKLYHTALDTPEKQAIVDGTTSSVKRYIHAVLTKEIGFFEDLKDKDGVDDLVVYDRLVNAFEKGRIDRGLLYTAYTKVYDTRKSAKKFALELRTLEPEKFGKDKLKQNGSKRYYEI